MSRLDYYDGGRLIRVPRPPREAESAREDPMNEAMQCGTCGDAVTFDDSDSTWVGSDGEVNCPADLSHLGPRAHGPIVADTADPDEVVPA